MSVNPRAILVPRRPPATQEWLDEMLRLYPAPCDRDCWHSSCWSIRDLAERLGAQPGPPDVRGDKT